MNKEADMGCCCNKYPVRTRASSVAVASGVTTITVPASVEITSGTIYEILLATPIPTGTDGTQVSITNGTSTAAVMKCNGNYFRPLPLRSRTVLHVQYLDDPAHFQLIRVCGRKACL